MPVEDQSTVHEIFDHHWQRPRLRSWDYLSQIIYERLKVQAPRCKSLLEAGSGSGRISLRLAREGALVTLLDISAEALSFSGQLFRQSRTGGSFSRGSLLDLPFQDDSFDLVWNAGVLEHFDRERKLAALQEMKRVCRPGGLVITFNPNQNSPLYRAGIRMLKSLNRWEYGELELVTTLEPLAKEAGLLCEKEFSEGFAILFIESFRRFLPLAGPHISDFLGWICTKARFRFARSVDLALAGRCGGYLITTVMRKAAGARGGDAQAGGGDAGHHAGCYNAGTTGRLS